MSQQHFSKEQEKHFLERNCKMDSLYVETRTSPRWISARVWDKMRWGHCASTTKPSPTPKPPTLQFCHYYCNSIKGCFLLSPVNQKSYFFPTQIPDVAEPAQTWEDTHTHTHARTRIPPTSRCAGLLLRAAQLNSTGKKREKKKKGWQI